ncbi:MAG TPA: ATP-binding cassette domain-containing protein [Bacilli bacterium]|nr:MAG: Energy-coupling factor transporter ATP-binding protein EcfA2 [Tenericutes bacterium ADurb.BinA124]HNZ50134.1 ATP-binding cassette domain-containing protein [Bacilli bacterium]HPN60652.1 ATP-binding cassette domain-containing protein [Bacilli bacterium]HPX84048.1 ATP-binding cassette domain-containing protein [Bacilli bacterium]HQC74058.1 ATP-binding cassette domain-containing protein [Bacilli bacterium]
MGILFSKVAFAYYRPRKKQYLRYILEDINLNIAEQDEMIAIVGHTGSGKSTLVQMMNALLLPTAGEVTLFKTKITPTVKLKPIRQKVGLVFQFPEYQIFEENVKKEIMFGPKNFKMPNLEQTALEAAQVMGITDLLERSPFTLSGGQLRKVAIASILATNPDVLILDEPTVGLDPLAKRELLDFLQKLHDDFHKSIIIITHDMEVVSQYIKRVIVLKEGKIIYDGSKKQLFAKDDLMDKYNLNYPSTVKILRALEARFHCGLDVNQHSIEAAYAEICRCFGERHE